MLHLHYCFQSNFYSYCYHCVVVIVFVDVVAAVTYVAVANCGCCCCCCYVPTFKKEMRGGGGKLLSSNQSICPSVQKYLSKGFEILYIDSSLTHIVFSEISFLWCYALLKYQNETL